MKIFNYECFTTFWTDFSIAATYGISAIKETYQRIFTEWKNDYKYLTELVMVLNHLGWDFYESCTAKSDESLPQSGQKGRQRSGCRERFQF